MRSVEEWAKKCDEPFHTNVRRRTSQNMGILILLSLILVPPAASALEGRTIVSSTWPCDSINYPAPTWINQDGRPLTLRRVQTFMGLTFGSVGGDFGVTVQKYPPRSGDRDVLLYLETLDVISQRELNYPEGVVIQPGEGIATGGVCENHGTAATATFVLIIFVD